jgi:hypothetical protein
MCAPGGDRPAPIGLSPAFGDDPAKQIQWSAFLKWASLTEVPHSLSEVVKELEEFLRHDSVSGLIRVVQDGLKRVDEVPFRTGV